MVSTISGVSAMASTFFPLSRQIGVAALLALVVVGACGRVVCAETGLHPINERRILGPARAKGVIVWSHGRSIEVEDSLAPTPAYVKAFIRAGWDVFRFDRMRVDDTLPRSGAAVAEIAERAKRDGYRRVVLAGQSFGGFISLIAATLSDAVDTVIATAPAAFGTAETNPDLWRLNETRLYELLEEVRGARIALAFFADDIFDPGQRGPRSRTILEARGIPYLMVDNPAGMSSHWASGTDAFAARFGNCLASFALGREPRRSEECDTGQASRLMATMR
jgi:pimeloyl-ACP methyl ester carboxylesterase